MSLININKRLKFAKKHLQKKTNWNRVIFSDEVQVHCNTKGRVYIKRRTNEAYHPNKLTSEQSNRGLKVNIVCLFDM